MSVSCRTVTSVWKRPKGSSVRGEVKSVDTPQGTAPSSSCHFPHPQELIMGSAHAPYSIPQPHRSSWRLLITQCYQAPISLGFIS